MITVEARHLSKVYRIYAHPQDRLKEFLIRGRRIYHREFWALRDVSFQLPAGSTLGVIGDNGSGKSTLLQLVAGTLQPTAGTARVDGRISAILELGAGFNPEFTGRENALMSGAIMGTPRREMERKLPEVAAFADIGDFFDQSVKIYSSGMYVRLAFAVATSVDPDVLIVDEALSVGDQYFQKRCVDRIEGFRKAGKTILFCSHNLYQIRMICDRAIWLREGRVAQQGETVAVVDAYENYLREREAQAASVPEVSVVAGPTRGPSPWLSGIRVSLDGEETSRDYFAMGDNLSITVWYQVPGSPTPVHVGIVINRNDAVQCFGTATHVSGVIPSPVSGKVSLLLPQIKLLSGEYDVSAYLLDDSGLHIYDQRLREVKFRVNEQMPHLGLCYLDHAWSFEAEALPPAELQALRPEHK